MDTLLPTQWIAQCADRIHQRWCTVEPAQLEELAVDLWKDAQLRAMLGYDALTPDEWIEAFLDVVSEELSRVTQ